VFIGFNAFILMAGTEYILGRTPGTGYAEVEWYANLWLVLVWIIYMLVFLGTIRRRTEPRIHVANWFFVVFFVTAGMLHIAKNVLVQVPFLATKIYTAFPGVQQWWHNRDTVGFFLIAGLLGAMYYFVPARIGRHVYSNKLAIAHCLVLCLIYIWFILLGSHRLYYIAYPDWVNGASVVISISLLLLFLAGMINVLTPLANAGSKLSNDPVIRFLTVAVAIMMVSVAFYCMSAFEGPLMSIKAVNSLSHYTDWTISLNHSEILGVGVLTMFGTLYCLVPWLWKRKELYSKALVEWHFWLSVLGILLYIGSMWGSRIIQGLMWQAYNDFGQLYSFDENIKSMQPYYIIRAVGGALFTLGALIMAFNLRMTLTTQPAKVESTRTVP
jgi:cytochrome c oxidase cbb3-type subunit 1